MRVDCAQEDAFRAKARIGGRRGFRDVFLQRHGHADDVQRDFNGLLVAFFHGERDTFDAGMDARRDTLVVLSRQFDFRIRGGDVRFAPADHELFAHRLAPYT